MFQSTNSLEYKDRPIELFGEIMREFKIGTVTGVYSHCDEYLRIINIENSSPGNGHFNDVFDWFFNSCITHGRGLMFVAVVNERLGDHLCNQRGFEKLSDSLNKGSEYCIGLEGIFRQMKG